MAQLGDGDCLLLETLAEAGLRAKNAGRIFIFRMLLGQAKYIINLQDFPETRACRSRRTSPGAARRLCRPRRRLNAQPVGRILEPLTPHSRADRSRQGDVSN